MSISLALILVLVSLLGLVWSADRFVTGAVHLASRWGLSALVIGAVVVGFGTSAPELLVSVLSASSGHPELALGNAYGSNIANIGLILALTGLIAPISIHKSVISNIIPELLIATGLCVFTLWDGTVTRLDAALLLGVFSILVYRALRQKPTPVGVPVDLIPEHHDLPLPQKSSLSADIWITLSGLFVLLLAAKGVVSGAVAIATWFGMSDVVVGLTVVAIGTSLPELASSVVAARKNHGDMVLGNILGSNLFNMMAVVGLAGVVSPIPVAPEFLVRDIPVMLAFTVALWGLCYLRRTAALKRPEMFLLLIAYVVYTWVLLQSSS